MMDFKQSWYEEKRCAYLYQIMANNEPNILHQKLFLDLAQTAEDQAIWWEAKIRENHEQLSAFKPGLRANIVAYLIKLLGTSRIHPILSTMKIRGMSVFRDHHTEHKHVSLNASNNLRAAVFGINDGLISNMSFILGVAGANANQHFIVIGGIACLLAGACSMGAGEYVSVRSQRDMYRYQIALERAELEEYPEEEKEELALIYTARGMPREEANKLAELMIKNPQTALSALAREELGLSPDDLVSPISAMIASFLSFSIGAVIPLIPFLFFKLAMSLYLSIGLTALTLFSIGAILSLYTNRNPIKLGLNMLLVGTLAGAITFGIGKLLGVKLS